MRTALAVIFGYMTTWIVVKTSLFATYVILGLDGAFQPGSYLPSGRLIAIGLVLGFLGAVLGGYLCAVISRDIGGPNLLAAAVLVLGLIMAASTLWARVDEPSAVRPPDVEIAEAARQAQQLAWVAFIHPFVGVAGILLGCRLRRRPKE